MNDDEVEEFLSNLTECPGPNQDWEPVVERWHVALARLDVEGDRVYALMESPDLAEEWPMYGPFEPGKVALN